MYEVYIPLMGKIRTEKSWQKTISELKRARPNRVYIVYYRTLENAQAKKKAREVFKNNKDKKATRKRKILIIKNCGLSVHNVLLFQKK